MNGPAFGVALGLAGVLVPLLVWGFRHLPREGWQFLAAVPVAQQPDGQWRGVNLTWYGAFNASALVLALGVFLFLMGAMGSPRARSVLTLALILGLALPAARWMARWIERKRNTFTVGGASFVGLLAAPAAVWLANRSPWPAGEAAVPVPTVAALAALCTAYCLGEGVGRLACISFGCCYGRRIADLGPRWQRLLGPLACRFAGTTRKIAYAAGWENTPVLPIQAITSAVCLTLGLTGVALLLAGAPRSALALAGIGSQLWRVASECLRADYRGGGRLTAYQLMGLAAAAVVAVVATGAGTGVRASPAAAEAGFSLLWHPGIILLLQALWLTMFLYTGRSTVTGSTLSFHVHRDRV